MQIVEFIKDSQIEIASMLESFGLGIYIGLFKDSGITIHDIFELKESDLKEAFGFKIADILKWRRLIKNYTKGCSLANFSWGRREPSKWKVDVGYQVAIRKSNVG